MVKIVYNNDFGGFGLNDQEMARYKELSGNKDAIDYKILRTDPYLVQVVEEMKPVDLRIRELPEGILYRIDEYDGAESVMTLDDYDWSIT